MKLSECSFKLNLKTCMLFEQLAEKSFFKCNDEVDIIKLMYSAFVINNDIHITFNAFLNLIEEKNIVKKFTDDFQQTSKFLEQFKKKNNEEGTAEGEDISMMLTDIAMSLIVRYKVDPHYVFYDMELWEITPFMTEIEGDYKADMQEKRMWAYINVMPHIDHKKCSSPEKLLPLPWEKKEKQDKLKKQLEINTEASKSILGFQLNIEEHAKGGLDNNIE